MDLRTGVRDLRVAARYLSRARISTPNTREHRTAPEVVLPILNTVRVLPFDKSDTCKRTKMNFQLSLTTDNRGK